MFQFIFFLFSASQTNKIGGHFPGKENVKLYISYFPPGIGSASKKEDSCIIDKYGKFEFISLFNEPVLCVIRFDYKDGFDFVTDTGVTMLNPVYHGRLFRFSAIEAVSPANKQYAIYKKYIRRESLIADSLYSIRDRYRIEKKKDSMKLLEPTLEYADSSLFQKNLQFVKLSDGNPIIKSLIIYRKLMLKLPLSEVKDLYTNLDNTGQLSLYGMAVNKYLREKEGLKIGDMAPSFVNQISPEGDSIRIEDFRGKYLLLDFWAAWCAPCRAENPTTIRIYDKYKSDHFEILGISLDRKKTDWLKAIEQDKLPWKQASDLQFWNNECVKLYGLYSLPFNILVDPEGKIIAIDLHGEDLNKRLDEIFR